MAFPLAVQLHSVRNDVSADFRGTLEQIKAMGYDGVEFAGLFGNDPDDVRKMCDEIGLVPISAHVPYNDMVNDAEGVMAKYAKIGCKYIAIPYLSERRRPGGEDFPNVVKNVPMIGSVANKFGIQLLYHNHDFDFIKFDGKYALDILYEEVPADLLKTELDVCWVKVGGEDPANYIRKYLGRAPVVHFKDFWGEKSENMYELIGIDSGVHDRPSGFELRPNGKGVLDFPEIITAARDAGTEWIVIEQDDPSLGLTPMECIKISIDYLKTINK